MSDAFSTANLIDTKYDLSTKQGIFDHVATALLKQGRRSMTNNFCAYRGEDGAKCAAGHLISDEVYTPALENRSIATFDELRDYTREEDIAHIHSLYDALDPRIPRSEEMIEFVSRIQTIHDTASRIDESDWFNGWKEGMLRYAAEYSLDTSVFN